MVESLMIDIENKSGGLSRTSNTNVTDENLNQVKRFHEKLLDEIDIIIRKNPSIFPKDTYYEEKVSGEEVPVEEVPSEEEKHDEQEDGQEDHDEEDGQEEHDLVLHFSILF
jgi:hypothetical protein